MNDNEGTPAPTTSGPVLSSGHPISNRKPCRPFVSKDWHNEREWLNTSVNEILGLNTVHVDTSQNNSTESE